MAKKRRTLAETFVNNPELIRNVRSGLSRNKLILLVLLTLAACAFNIILCIASEAPSRYLRRSINAEEIAAAFRYAFFIAAGVQLGLLGLSSIALVSAAVAGERDLKTWDLQRMTPMSPLAMAWGKLVGSNAAVWVVVLSSFPAQAVSVMAGGVGLGTLLQVWLLVLAGGLLSGAFVLAVSAACENRRNAVVLSLLAMSVFGGVSLFGLGSQAGWPLGGLNAGSALGGILEENRGRWGPPMYRGATFFWFEFDVAWLSIVWEGLAAWALLVGASRLMCERGLTLWSKWQGLAVFGAACTAAVGACWGLRGTGSWQQEAAQIGCAVSLVLGAFIMAFVMTPCYASARAWIRGGTPGPVRGGSVLMEERSPAFFVMAIFWLMVCLVMFALGKFDRAFGAALVAAPWLLAVTALVAICTTALKKHGKAVAFAIIIAWCVAAGIVAAIASSEEMAFAIYPPVAIGVILEDGYSANGWSAFAGAMGLWAVIGVALLAIWVSQILRLREIMAKLARR